jgi:hypothetical protein
MAIKIELKRSAVPGKVPNTSSLDLGEVAINTYDGKLYFKKDNGAESIVQLADVSGSVVSASYAVTASYALNTQNIDTGSLVSTSSFNAYTSSINTYTSSLNSVTSSFVRNLQTSSMSVASASYANNADLLDGKDSTEFATTGSNTFVGNQIISGAINTTGILTVQNAITTPSGQYFVAYSDTSTELSWQVPFAPSIPVFSGIGSSNTGFSINNTSTDSNGDALPSKIWSFRMDGKLTVPGDITGAPNLATTGSNTFVGNQIVSGNIYFANSSSIYTNNAYDIYIKPNVSGAATLLSQDESHYVLVNNNGTFANDLTVDGFLKTTDFRGTGSLQGTASFANNATSATSASYAATSSFADNFTVAGTLTAQTLVVQTISSSVI